MNLLSRVVLFVTVIITMVFLTGCAPEVGSKPWCDNMDKKPKGDWTANEATEYAKSCLLR